MTRSPHRRRADVLRLGRGTTHSLDDVYPTVDTRLAGQVNGQLERGGGTSYNAFNFDNFSVQYGVCVCLCKERVHDTFLWS